LRERPRQRPLDQSPGIRQEPVGAAPDGSQVSAMEENPAGEGFLTADFGPGRPPGHGSRPDPWRWYNGTAGGLVALPVASLERLGGGVGWERRVAGRRVAAVARS